MNKELFKNYIATQAIKVQRNRSNSDANGFGQINDATSAETLLKSKQKRKKWHSKYCYTTLSRE